MSSKRLESCDRASCACEHHGGLARHLVYGVDYAPRAIVHRATPATDGANRDAVKRAMSGHVALSIASRNKPEWRKLTDRSPD